MEKGFAINRFILSTVVVMLIAAVAGWEMSSERLWPIAILYGGVVSVVNFWLLYMFISRLLTVSLGFDYKALAVLGLKFLILFGGLSAGYFIFKLPIIPLMIGFFSFFGGLVIEVIFWTFSTPRNG
ncbi:MAG: hypothetical protein A3F16_01810 [Deltaproteobacteria bacterium RIFCSPHIGHO2_12_FULL_43_9]|nr:MAG: hypothetical protein A3F16_01810 [Deltaproteobacteria bacterium RIFCSPHIGHO2_12_FULL_43_9]